MEDFASEGRTKAIKRRLGTAEPPKPKVEPPPLPIRISDSGVLTKITAEDLKEAWCLKCKNAYTEGRARGQGRYGRCIDLWNDILEGKGCGDFVERERNQYPSILPDVRKPTVYTNEKGERCLRLTFQYEEQ